MVKTIDQLTAKPTDVEDSDFIEIISEGTTYKVDITALFLNRGLAVTTSNGTYVHSNGTTEDDVVELTANKDRVEYVYDVSLLTQNTTIRVYEKVDGTNYQPPTEKIFPTDFEPNVEAVTIELVGHGRDQKITFQSGTGEGTDRNIPFNKRTEVAT